MRRVKNLLLLIVVILLAAVLLRRLLGVYAISIPLLYMFFDLNGILRVTWMILKELIFSRRATRNFLDVSETSFIVLPSDMDLNLHMNNARYLRECDFGRMDLWIKSGMFNVARKNKCRVTIAASCVRYRRSLELFQNVLLKTRVLAWDEKAFYLEQRFSDEDGFVYATVLTKNQVIQRQKEHFVSPADLVHLLTGESVQSPSLSQDLDLWIQYNSASSAMMKNAFPTSDEQKRD